MITTNRIQEEAVRALGEAFVSECTDYSGNGEARPGVQISTSEHVLKIFHKKYKTRSREFALDLLQAILPESMRRTVIDALSSAEAQARNQEPPDHLLGDRYEAARKALMR